MHYYKQEIIKTENKITAVREKYNKVLSNAEAHANSNQAGLGALYLSIAVEIREGRLAILKEELSELKKLDKPFEVEAQRKKAKLDRFQFWLDKGQPTHPHFKKGMTVKDLEDTK